jgi:hypothetical protein
MGQQDPIIPGEKPNYQSAAHFYSKDFMTWTYTGDGSGVVAGGSVESTWPSRSIFAILRAWFYFEELPPPWTHLL